MEQKDVWCSSVLTAASTAPQPLFPASMSIISDATSSITAEGDRQLPVDSSTTTEDNPTSTNNVIWSQISSRGTASGGNDINTNSEQSQRELLPPAPSSTVRPATNTEFLVPDDWELPMARSFGFHGDESSSCSTISNSLATLLSYPSFLPDDRLSSSTAVTLPDFPPHHFPPNQVKQEFQMLEYSGSSNATATTTTVNTTTWLQGSNSYNYLREPERPSLPKIHSDCINRASLPFHFFDSSSATNNSFIGNNVGGYNFTSTHDLLPADHAIQLQCFDGNTSSPTALLPAYIHNINGQPSLATTVIPCQPGVFEGLNNNSKDQQLASSSNCVFNRFPNIDVSSAPSLHNSSEQKQINEEPAGSNKRARIDSSGSASSGLKVRKEKLGDRITSLQQLVSPFGKTDTASVLLEAIGYIKFLQEQVQVVSFAVKAHDIWLNVRPPVQVLSMPYMKATAPKRPRGGSSSSMAKEEGEFLEEPSMDLRSRGLCLVPVSCTFQVANDNGADFWAPSLGSGYR